METNSAEQDVKPLFPISLSSSENTCVDGVEAPARPLFPVLSSQSGNVSAGTDDLDWLENKSFIPTSILLAQEEAKERFRISQSQVKQDPDARVSPSPSDDESRTAVSASASTDNTALKRRVSSSESDGESLHTHKTSRKHSDGSKKKKKKHKKKAKKHKKKESKSSPPPVDAQTKKHEEFWLQRTTKVFAEEIPGLEPEFAFRFDRKSEKSLWNYESLSKNHIARYGRVTDRCLGNTNINLYKKQKGKGVISRYFARENRKGIRSKGLSVSVKAVKDLETEQHVFQYISVKDKVSEDSSALSREENDPLGIYDYATHAYSQGKGVEGKGETENPSGSYEMFEKVAYYNRKLKEAPSDVKLWMEFVHFQDLVFQDTRFSAKHGTKTRIQDAFQPSRTCIDKKLAILEKALEANPSNIDLQLLKLEIEQDVCDSKTQAKEWDRLLFVHAGNVELWRHYLTFQQSRLATFTVGRTVKLYHKFFKTLTPILDGKVEVVKKQDGLEEKLLGVFEQYCSFLHQSGQTEKAVGSYQALIEFNLFKPSALNLTPTPDCVAVFESFWDSGVARFGEPGARGWAAWVEGSRAPQTAPVSHESIDEQQEEILNQDMPKHMTWLKIERLRQNAHWLPWHPDTSKGETDEDCEDLDRLVLYDDVSPILFCLHQSQSFSRLVHAFVSFLGLQQSQTVEKDGAQLDQLHLCSAHQVQDSSQMDMSAFVDALWKPGEQTVHFLEEVLRQAAAYFTGWHQSLFKSQLLRLHCEKQGCQDITGLSEQAMKEARKFGKSLLKEVQNRNDLMLWNAYIRQEWALGKKKDAVAMLETALGMFVTTIPALDDHAASAGLCSLFRTWAEIHLCFTPLELVHLTSRQASPSAESKKKVVSSFISLVDRTEFRAAKLGVASAAQVLRTRKKFQQQVDQLFNETVKASPDQTVKQHIVQLVTCFALFELCATGIAESLQVFDAACHLCVSNCHQAEDLMQSRKLYKDLEFILRQDLLALLQNYMSVEAVTTSLLRSHLQTALSRFPDSPSLLGHLVQSESRTYMAGRLRRFFEKATREPASVYPVLFEVLAEMSRHFRLRVASGKQTFGQAEGLTDSGTVHRVRAACERGVRHAVSKHCPLLWRLYLRFEAEHGSVERAKGIFYRALQACPWAKVLYMDGTELFGEEQLDELADLMMEKEIRLQIPLEEMDLLLASEPQAAKEEAGSEDCPSPDTDT